MNEIKLHKKNNFFYYQFQSYHSFLDNKTNEWKNSVCSKPPLQGMLGQSNSFDLQLKIEIQDRDIIGRASLVNILRDVARFTPLLARLVQ